jgi:serpin B
MSRLSLLLSLLLATGRLAQPQTCAHRGPTHHKQAPSSHQKTVTSLPRPLTAVEGNLVLADNRFTLKLFRQVATTTRTDSNVVVSPFSVATALAMAYNGAAGRTYNEMQRALSLEGMTLQDVNDAYRAFPRLLRAPTGPSACRAASGRDS